MRILMSSVVCSKYSSGSGMQICRLCEVGVDMRYWDSAGGPAQWGLAEESPVGVSWGKEKVIFQLRK